MSFAEAHINTMSDTMPVEAQFRKASWGMSKSDIRARETSTPIEDSDEQIIYNGSLVGTPCLVSYTFHNGRLVGGDYFIDNADDVSDITDYEKLQEMLTTKYCEPRYQEHEWKDAYRSVGVTTYGQLAKAIARGDVTLRTQWQTRDTRITLLCTESSTQYNALVLLLYGSLEHLEHQEAAVQDRDIDLL